MTMTMKAVFFRHATRSVQGLGDAQLNAAGLRQAEELASGLSPQGPLPHPTHLMCSPKKRARQTLAPLSARTQLPLIIDERLDERRQNESTREFEDRVRSLTEEILSPETKTFLEEKNTTKGCDPCVFLCSHLDWLETAMALVPSDMSDAEIAAPWTTAEFRVFRIEGDLWMCKGGGVIGVRG